MTADLDLVPDWSAPGAPPPPPEPQSRRPRWLTALVAVALLAAGIGVGVLIGRGLDDDTEVITAPTTTATPAPTTTAAPTTTVAPTTTPAPTTTAAPTTTVAPIVEELLDWRILTSDGRLLSLIDGVAPKLSEVDNPAAATANADGGWWVVDTDGAVTGWDGAEALGDARLSITFDDSDRVVGIDGFGAGTGYWILRSNGSVTAVGDAPDFGSVTLGEGATAVALAATPDGTGYWVALADGTVVPFGTAPTLGDARDVPLNAPIVDMATGQNGYWLLAADGGIFNYGEDFLGSGAGAEPLPAAASTLGVIGDGDGYVIVTADGELIPFGDVSDEIDQPDLADGETVLGLVQF